MRINNKQNTTDNTRDGHQKRTPETDTSRNKSDTGENTQSDTLDHNMKNLKYTLENVAENARRYKRTYDMSSITSSNTQRM